MTNQIIPPRRCGSCERWQGPRLPGDAADTARVAGERVQGLCVEGPWHGRERGALAACGRWIAWAARG
jgi:hypothetical protein